MLMRLMTPVGTNVTLVDAAIERADESRSMLREQGYTVAGHVRFSNDLLNFLKDTPTDVIVIHAGNIDSMFLDALKSLPDELRRPTVLFSEDSSPESIHAAVAVGVNAYVVVGVNGGRMRSAINLARANFSNTAGLREELNEARTALRERKIVERAKGLIMKQKDIDEAEAYDLLRKRAMQKGMRLVDIATMINEAAEVMSS